MARALADSLLPGESLYPGEYLQSANGLYRLYFEPTGHLSLKVYTIDTPVAGRSGTYNIPTAIWGQGGGDLSVFGPPVRLLFPAKGGCQFRNANNDLMWQTFGTGIGQLTNHRFLLQDDGNLVHYIDNPSGGYFARWASGSDAYARELFPRTFPPNTATAIIQVGTVAIDTAGNGDFRNETNVHVGVRDGSTYVGVPSGGTVALQTGDNNQVQAESKEYSFLFLSGPVSIPNNAPQSSSADAIRSRGKLTQTRQGGRVVVKMVNGFGLTGGQTEALLPFVPYTPPEELLERDDKGKDRK